jgi:hypothetical protein
MTPNIFLRAGLFLVMFSVMAAVAQNEKVASTKDGGEAELRQLEKVWNDAHVTGDAATLDGLWADELTVTVPKMPVFDKKQSLAIWKTGRMKFSRYETSDLAFRTFGETAIVTGALVRDRKFGEKAIHEDWRFTKVYVRRDGKWRVVAWHASESAPP